MFRTLFERFRPPLERKQRCVPSSPDLPTLWSDDSAGIPRVKLDVLDNASTKTLTDLCDQYWNSFFEDDEDDTWTYRNHNIVRRALEILVSRGAEALPWARQRLTHPGYDAREDAAAYIMQLAEKQLLGPEKDIIAQELAALATRPWEEDTKETQAAGVALMALAIVGGPALIYAIRYVITSGQWDDDDHQSQAVDILSKRTGVPFQEADDPIAAANEWLNANPEYEG